MRFIAFVTGLCLCLGACRAPQDSEDAPASHPPVAVILDTDMGPDYDDVGALAMLHHLADRGEAHILATLSCNRHPAAAPTIDLLNTYLGRPDLPIGAAQADSVPDYLTPNHWNQRLMARFPYDLPSSQAAPPAVAVYRRVLAAQPDSSVTVVSIGWLSNLAELLRSGPDSLSPLTGRELVASKVDHWFCMGGRFPEGREFNLMMDAEASAYAIERWPTPITFSGGEIGSQIFTGKRLVAEGDSSSPVWMAYEYCMRTMLEEPQPEGRESWDQTAVLTAVRGLAPWFEADSGRASVDPEDGHLRWDPQGQGHRYLRFAWPPDSIAQDIEALMMEP